MLTTLRNRLHHDEDGFTLIELMVVVTILGILMAIAIPTFLGSQNKAKDSSVKADLRNALTVAKSLAADQAGAFVSTGTTALTSTDLQTAEPNIAFAAAASTSAVGVYVGTNGANIALVKTSKGGPTYGIAADSTGVVKYCKSSTATAVADCDSFSDTGYTTTPW